jgi:hypothetical protein
MWLEMHPGWEAAPREDDDEDEDDDVSDDDTDDYEEEDRGVNVLILFLSTIFHPMLLFCSCCLWELSWEMYPVLTPCSIFNTFMCGLTEYYEINK